MFALEQGWHHRGAHLAAGEGAGLRGWTAPLPLPRPLVGVVGRGEGRAGDPWGTEPTIRPVLGSIRNLQVEEQEARR